jgi:hypothetical protein
MNKSELDAAMRLAQDKNFRTIDNDGKLLVSLEIFDGFALPGYQPKAVTTAQVAALIRWQCFQLNGDIDADALQEIANAGRHRFTVVG